MMSIRRFLSSEEGPTSVEYAVMLALILAAMIATIKVVGDRAGVIWSTNSQKIEEADL